MFRYREPQATKNASGLLCVEVELIQVEYDFQYLLYRILPSIYFNNVLADAFWLNTVHCLFDLLAAQLIRFAIHREFHLDSSSSATYHTYYYTTSTYFVDGALTHNPIDASVRCIIEDARDDGEEYATGSRKRVGEGGSPTAMPARNAPRSGLPKKAAMQVGGGGWRPRRQIAE